MNWKINIVILILFISACEPKTTSEIETVELKSNTVTSDYLIEANELIAIVENPDIKIIDLSSEENYNKGHIMGAFHIKRSDIEDSTFSYTGIMASLQQIEGLFGALGIDNNDTLVIYDDNGLCEAARLWWILQNYSYTKVKLLHGGIEAWKAQNGTVSIEVPKHGEAIFKLPSPTMKYYIAKEDVQAAIDAKTVILDTRSTEEYTGSKQKNGAAKAGRIPNSIHIDWAEAINYHGDKKFKSYQELEDLYSLMNIKKDDPVVVYCHSGVRSAHTTFVLTQLMGFKNVKNYDGSWIEWSHFDDLSFEKDSLTSINL